MTFNRQFNNPLAIKYLVNIELLLFIKTKRRGLLKYDTEKLLFDYVKLKDLTN